MFKIIMVAALLIIIFSLGVAYVDMGDRQHAEEILSRLDKISNERFTELKSLFDQQIPNYSLEEIRNALNKAWVLGEDRFKKQIEEQTGRLLSPKKCGGDRKSAKYRADH